MADKSRKFWDKETKAEMLELRKMGCSLKDLAVLFDVDHTTIIYHCQAARIILTKVERETMNFLVREGLTFEEVGSQLNAPAWVIEHYCTTYGVPGSEKYPMKKKVFPQTFVSEEATKKRVEAKKKSKILFKTDHRGVMWRTDEFGEWICLGRSSYRKKAIPLLDKREILNKKRKEMLEY